MQLLQSGIYPAPRFGLNTSKNKKIKIILRLLVMTEPKDLL